MDFPTLKKRLDDNYLLPIGAPVRLELPAENVLESAALSKVIEDYSPDRTLLVPFTKREETASQIILTGTALFFRGQLVERDCCIVFQVVDEQAVFTMVTSALASGYNLAEDFKPFEGTSIAGLPFASAQLILSTVANSAVTQPICEQSGLRFESGLNFNGVPSGGGSLAPYAWLFEDLSSVVVHGTLTLDANDNPACTLKGIANQSVSIGPISIQPGVEVAGQYEPPGTTDVFLASARFFTIVEIGTSKKIPVRISTELIGDEATVVTVEIDDGSYQISSFDDLSSLAGGQNLQALLPEGKYQLPAATTLELSDLTLTFDLHEPALIGIGASVRLITSSPWPLLPLGILSLTEIGVTFEIDISNVTDGKYGVTAAIFGQIEIGTAFRYNLSVELPALAVSGTLPPAGSIPVGQFLNALFSPLVGDIPGLDDALTIDQLEFLAYAREGSFFLSILVTEPWPLNFPLGSVINVTGISLDANYSNNQWGLALGAKANLLESIPTFVNAVRPAGAQGWTFSFGTEPGEQVQLIPVIQRFFSTDITTLPLVPSNFYLLDVLLEVDTATMDYSFQATAGAGWKLNLGPVGEVSIEASVDIKATKKPEAFVEPFAIVRADPNGEPRVYSGSISGKLTIGRFEMSVTYAFAEENTTLTFTFTFRGVTLTAILTTEEDENQQKITVITASLGDLSFGDVLTYLVNLVDPSLNFQLEPPWDFLNQINFKNLQFKLKLPPDKSKWTAEILYNVNQDFVIAHLDKVGLAYALKNGRRTVQIIITGQFLEQQYTDQKPLSWDLLNDPAPQPAGQGSKLIDVRYLGLGQNVAFRDARSFKNVQSVLDALEQDFKPVDENQNPLTSLAPLKFSGDGRWLIAADLSLLSNTVSLALVFADPELYGLRIALAGEKAKSLAGLEFEILYRKVTDTIGVYALELKLPDALRQFDVGAASVTLPIIGIEIYTNGNFRIDFGFPRGGDFSRSFAIQWLPFIGAGGFYFALLNGSTSKRVPVISNGYFNPVIEFGLGLQVGVGKTIDKGVLKAGATLTAQAIIEGVIAWFYPNGAASSDAQFFLIQGQAAIVGMIYGAVDFVIIKAKLSITAKASVTLTIEAYQPTLVALQLQVEVSASVTILFFTVSFSFSMELDLSLTVGSASPTPWVVTSPRPQTLLLRQARGRYPVRPLKAVEILSRLRSAENASIDWNWEPRQVFDTKRPLLLSAAPSFTAALDGDAVSKVTVVMALWTPNSVPASARTAAEVMHVRMAAPGEAPFNALVEGILRWAIAALPRPDSNLVTAADLQAIADYLADNARRRAVFTYDRLREFLRLNYDTQIGTPLAPTGATAPAALDSTAQRAWGRWSRWSGAPATPSISDLIGERGPVGLAGFSRPAAAPGADAQPAAFASAPEDSGTIFPMIPDLLMGPQSLPQIDFSTYNPVGATYEACLDRLFNQLDVNVDQASAKDPTDRSACGAKVSSVQAASAPSETESLATFLFRDYFGLIAKAAVEAAIQLLKKYPYTPRPFDTLASIAASFPSIPVYYRPRRHDTLGSIALAFGASPQQLAANNPHLAHFAVSEPLPQDEVQVDTGVTPISILSANPDYLLSATGPSLPLAGVQYQVKSGDSLWSAAASLGLTGPMSFFGGAAGAANSGNTALFQTGATFTIPAGRNFDAQTNDLPASQAFLRAAAFFTVRGATGFSPESFPYLAWYTQQIVDLNQNNPAGITFSQTDLSAWAGATISVPVAALGNTGLAAGGTAAYTIRAADNINFIGALFEQAQLGPTGIAPLTWAIAALNPQVSGPAALLIPQLSRSIQPGDSLDRISQLYGASPQDLMGLGAPNAGATGLLQPLAVLAAPVIDYQPAFGDTPARIAAAYDLTLDDLAASIEGVTGIFPADGPALTVPDVPALEVDKLIGDLIRLGRFNSISAITSRFLLHGLRIPQPSPDFKCDELQAGPRGLAPAGGYGGLYALAGQQFASPTGITAAYPVRFSKGASGDWFRFAPQNPSELDVVLSPETISDNAPSVILDPQITAGPTAAALFVDAAPRYGLEQSLHWQAASVPILPPGATGTVAGQPSLWLFPQTLANLLANASGLTGTPPYQLIEASPRPGDPQASRALDSYAWATALPFRVRRIPSDAPGDTLPNSYLLLGVDQSGRDSLLQLWTYLRDSRQPRGAKLYVLYQRGTSTNSPSLASDAIDPVQTFLLKTNLSTVTHSGPDSLAGRGKLAGQLPASGEYYARINAPGEFLKFLWEGSITASGGYYLNYVNSNGGAGLPSAVFASGGDAALWLLVVLDRQSGISGLDRSLFPFTNCAAVGQNVSFAPSSLFARLANPRPDELVRVATVPPGVIGFELSRVNPDFGMTAGTPTTPEQRTRSLFSLIGFKLASNDFFRSSPQGLPAGPNPADSTTAAGVDSLVSATPDPRVWAYRQMLPASRFGLFNALPASAALPAAASNPYAGITGSTASPGPASLGVIDLAFQDIYGNRTQPSQPLAPVNATVGYTDPLIGPASWPSLVTGYEFLSSGDPNAVQLRTVLRLQLAPYAPGSGIDSTAALNQASADAARYKQIYYQTAQPDVSFELSTNLGTAPPSDLRRSFSEFVTGAYTYLESTSQLEAVGATAGTSDTLTSVASAYSVSPTALVTANSRQQATGVFANPIVVPQLRGARAGDSLGSLAAIGQTASQPGMICPPTLEAASVPVRTGGIRRAASGPLGFAAPSGATALTPQLVAANNAALPITSGITFQIPQQTYTVPSLTGPASTLSAIASSLSSNVYADFPDPSSAQTLPVGLVPSNYPTKGLLAGNVLVIIHGEQQVTAPDSSFEDLHTLFADLGLTMGEFAVAIANVEGLLKTGAVLNYSDRVIAGATGTFAALSQEFGDLDQLAAWNSAVPSVFADGSPVFLNSKCVRLAESLEDVAISSGLTLDQLAVANALTPLTPGRCLEVANLLRVPQDTSALFVRYAAAQHESLTAIATLFGTGAVTLGRLNAELHGILQVGLAIKWLPWGSAIVQPDSTLRSIYDEIPGSGKPPFDDFLEYISGLPLIGLNAILFAPLPRIPGQPPPDQTVSQSLRALCERFHLVDPAAPSQPEVAALVGANRSLDGFLRTGAVLLGATGLTAAVGPHGTFQQMSERFQATGATVSIAQLAALNADTPGLLTTGNPFLLPPQPVLLETAVTPQIPPAGATGEAAVIFPVGVSVTERRAPWLVSPDFQRSSEVFTAQSPIPPLIDAASGPLSLTAFAAQFETVFAPHQLKIATSQDGNSANPSRSGMGIWAVNLGASGIRQFQILQNEPRFYAIPPLSTELQSFDRVPVSEYRSGQGLCWPPQLKNFESVDLDSWMRELLAAVDLALAAPYATAAFQQTPSGPRSFSLSQRAFVLGATGSTGATCMPYPGATGPFGPRDYDTLVEAKQAIASGLSRLVEPVLQLPPVSPFYLDDARQAFCQQMLARLSDAYNFDALVQFPVHVESPFSSTWTPGGLTGVAPRLAGKLSADLYVTGREEPLAHVAASLGVSLAYLCEALLDVRGIIRAGVAVEYAPPAYLTTTETTIRTLADFFHIGTNLADEANWPAWRLFAAFLGNLEKLLNDSTSLPLVRASRTLLSNDTFGSLEAFFNVGPSTFGHANESPATDLLRPGARIDLDPQQRNPVNKRFYTVLPGQTILDIVAGINQQYPALNIDVATLCIIARDQPALLNPGKAVYLAELSPNYTATNPKVNLGTVNYAGTPLPPPLSFLLTVKEAAARRKIFLNLRYAVNEAEYGVANVAGVSGYQSSSWLTFVLPPGTPGEPVPTGFSTAMQQLAVPLPLKAYPTPPSLLAQHGSAAYPEAANLAGARKWNYSFSYQATNAGQDTTYFEVSFANRRRQLSAAALEANQNLVQRLARPLAQFIEIYPALKPDLAQLPQLGAGGNPLIAAVAFQTMAQLADRVADVFRNPRGFAQSQQSGLLPKQIYSFKVQNATDITGRNLEVLNLDLVGYTGPASGALGFTGLHGGWPGVWVTSAAGETALTLENFGPTAASYLYPENVPANAALTQRVEFDNRDVIQAENGWAGVYLTRNEDLISSGPLGPTAVPGITGPVATNPSFVYRTPPVRFINKLTPLITNQNLIAIESIGAGPARRTLEAYLGDLFDALLDLGPAQKTTGDYTIKLSCNYAFPLGTAGPQGIAALSGAAADSEILASSPLLLRPSVLVGLANKSQFVAQIAHAIRDWVRNQNVPIDIGRLVFQVTVFSAEGEFQMRALREAVATGATAITQPLLDLENLQLKMSNVDWGA